MTLHMMRTSNGWGPNPITLREIREYIEMFGALPMDLDIAVRLIKQCDEAALAWIRKKEEARKPKES
jgi:hypothetical protein